MDSETLIIPVDHPSLPGHFPGNPIVPGALLLDCVIRAAQGRGLRVGGISQARFTAPLRPDIQFRIEFSDGRAGVAFQLISTAGTHAEGSLQSAGAGDPGLPALYRPEPGASSVLDAQELCSRLPHGPGMCLLDRVLSWDSDGLRCVAISHCEPGNPLRNGQGLPVVIGVEYAAQAMAVHAGLVAGNAVPRSGYLAGLRNLRLELDWLHRLEADLQIGVQRYGGNDLGSIYDFRLEAAGRSVLSGRATVMYTDEGASGS